MHDTSISMVAIMERPAVSTATASGRSILSAWILFPSSRYQGVSYSATPSKNARP